MGVLSDYSVAGADELAEVGGDGELPKAWPRFEAKDPASFRSKLSRNT